MTIATSARHASRLGRLGFRVEHESTGNEGIIYVSAGKRGVPARPVTGESQRLRGHDRARAAGALQPVERGGDAVERGGVPFVHARLHVAPVIVQPARIREEEERPLPRLLDRPPPRLLLRPLPELRPRLLERLRELP